MVYMFNRIEDLKDAIKKGDTKLQLPLFEDLLRPCVVGNRIYLSALDLYKQEYNHKYRHDYEKENIHNLFKQEVKELAKLMGQEDRIKEEYKFLKAVEKGKLAEYIASKPKELRPTINMLINTNALFSTTANCFDVMLSNVRFNGAEESHMNKQILQVFKLLDLDKEMLEKLKVKGIKSNSSLGGIDCLSYVAEMYCRGDNYKTYQGMKTLEEPKSIFKSLFKNEDVIPISWKEDSFDSCIYNQYLLSTNNKLKINVDDYSIEELNEIAEVVKKRDISKINLINNKPDETKFEAMNNIINDHDHFIEININSNNNMKFDFAPGLLKQKGLTHLTLSNCDFDASLLLKDKSSIIYFNIMLNEQRINEIVDSLKVSKPKMLSDIHSQAIGIIKNEDAIFLMEKYPDLVLNDNNVNIDTPDLDKINTLKSRNKKVVEMKLKYGYNLNTAIGLKVVNEVLMLIPKEDYPLYDDIISKNNSHGSSFFYRMKEAYGDNFMREFAKTAEILGFKDRLSVEFKIVDEAKKGNIVECLQIIDKDIRPSFASLLDKQSIFNSEKNIFEQMYDNNPHTFAKQTNQILDLYGVKVEDLKAMKDKDKNNYILSNLINVKTQANAMARRKQQITMSTVKSQNDGKE